jgi:hypothetical protein
MAMRSFEFLSEFVKDGGRTAQRKDFELGGGKRLTKQADEHSQ